MKKRILVLGVAMMFVWPAVTAIVTRSFGAPRGGGVARGTGGGRAGGVPRAMPSPSYNRSPSLSRPGAAPRPAPHVRPDAGARRPSLQGPSSFGRPTPSQLNNFLGLPTEPGTRGGTSRTATSRPASSRPASAANRGSFNKTIEGPHGGEITIAGKGGKRTGPGGATIGAGRVGVKIEGPGGNTYTRVSGGAAIRGPGGNTVAAGRGAAFVNGQFVGGRTWTAVNGRFTHWNYYGPRWYVRYPGAWWPVAWVVPGVVWTPATWAAVGPYCGLSGDGCYYDYSQNVTYEDDDVYYGDQPVASAEQYFAEARRIASSGREPQNEEWLPLGVFAVVKDGEADPERLVQLAVNKEGVVRGNYHDLVTNKVTPIIGAVDKQTQRVAIKAEGNDTVILETGLYNLTNDEVPVLLHFGLDRQHTRTLVRLKKPETEGGG